MSQTMSTNVLIVAFNDGRPDFRGVTHALDCAWALGAANSNPKGRIPPKYVTVAAATVPSQTERCGHCGGGR